MIAVWVSVAVAAEIDDLEGHIAQAKFFIKKGWYDDAERELTAAVALPDGKLDPTAWFLLANVRYELFDVEGASAAAERAQTYSRTDDELTQAATFAAFLREQFGVVIVSAPYEGLVGSLDVQLTSTLFDPALKSWLERSLDKQKGRLLFPVRLSLPVADYTINGVAVSVRPAEVTGVTVDVAKAVSTQLAKAEFSAGLGFWFGPQAKNLAPAPSFEVSLSQPVGPLVFGALFDWEPRPYTTVDNSFATSLSATAVGGRIGVDIPGLGIQMRPSLGYRYAVIPGIRRDCIQGDGVSSCYTSATPEWVFYGAARAHVAFAELSVDWLDRKRKQTLGLGVKVIGERAFGKLPASGTAAFTDDTPIDYEMTPDQRTFSAYGLRTLLNFTVAF